METESKETYERQKEQLLQLAEDTFGKLYFERLDKLTKDYLTKDIKLPKYRIFTNDRGTFDEDSSNS